MNIDNIIRTYNKNNGTDTKVVHKSGGISFLGALFLVFLTLKLTNVIAWSWWWVTAPLWIPLAIVLGILTIIVVAAIVVAFICRK